MNLYIKIFIKNEKLVSFFYFKRKNIKVVNFFVSAYLGLLLLVFSWKYLKKAVLVPHRW